MILVFLADDHPVVRAGLRYLLETSADIEVVGEAADGRETLNAALGPDWNADVLVLDISLPKVSGIEVLRRLSAQRPQLPILMLSMHAEAQYARRLVAMGAAGYVSKDRSEDELITAIRAVAAGQLYLSRRVAADGCPDERAPHDLLSARQMQVFLLVVAGRSVSDIAAELDLTVSTISTHLGHVKQKLGLTTVAEVVGYGHRMNLA